MVGFAQGLNNVLYTSLQLASSSPPKSEELMLHVLQHNDNSVSSLKPTSLWILAALFSPAVTVVTLSRFNFSRDKEYDKYYYTLSNILLVHLPKCTSLVSLLKMFSMSSCSILCIVNFTTNMQNIIFPMVMRMFCVL